MKSYRSEVRISRPPDTVFPFVVDPKKQALWSDVPMRQVTEGPLRVGSRMEVSFGMGLMKAVVGLEIVGLEHDKGIRWKAYSGPIGWDGRYSLEPDGSAGTRLSQEGTLTFHGLWRLMEPIVGAEISSGEVKELERLKKAAEDEAAG